MGGQIIDLSQGIITLAAAVDQDPSLAFDTAGTTGSRFDFEVRCLALAGGGTLAITLQTSMSKAVDGSTKWTDLRSTAALSSYTSDVISLPDWSSGNTKGVLRYLRYSVAFGGTVTSVTFDIRGMAW